MTHLKTDHNPKGAGRPRKSANTDQNGQRRFFMLEKNDKTIALMKLAHATHRRYTGKDGTDAEVLRAALAVYGMGNPESAKTKISWNEDKKSE